MPIDNRPLAWNMNMGPELNQGVQYRQRRHECALWRSPEPPWRRPRELRQLILRLSTFREQWGLLGGVYNPRALKESGLTLWSAYGSGLASPPQSGTAVP